MFYKICISLCRFAGLFKCFKKCSVFSKRCLQNYEEQ